MRAALRVALLDPPMNADPAQKSPHEQIVVFRRRWHNGERFVSDYEGSAGVNWGHLVGAGPRLGETSERPADRSSTLAIREGDCQEIAARTVAAGGAHLHRLQPIAIVRSRSGPP